MSRPRASIIVLCFNGLKEATEPCIDSIYRNTPVDDFELVAVDNASTDGTADYLRRLEASHSNVKLCLNSINKGYAGGNNDGLRFAKGEYLILLNNDTLVPPGWLDSLLSLLETNSSIGMAGPVTNSAGNEQRVNIKGLTADNYELLAAEYVSRNQGEWSETQRLGFYCVAFRREVLDRVGLLDENFGTGMFEDDDYCIRTQACGFRLAVLEGCFVYHKGSVAFSKLQHAEYHALFQKNKRYFNSKHNTNWALSDIAFAYLDKMEHDLGRYSEKHSPVCPEIERVVSRIDNFRHLLVQVRQAELSNQAEGYSPPPIETRFAKYKRRLGTVKNEFIFGLPAQRARLVKRVWRHYSRLFVEKTGLHRARELRMLGEMLPYQKGKKVIFFPATVDFDYMTQRPQHLARAFSEAGFFVIYGTLNHSTDKVRFCQKKSESLFLVNQYYFPLMRHIFAAEDCFYYCMWPSNLAHVESLPYHKLVYDYMDDLELLDMDQGMAEQNHQALLQRADLVTVSSHMLYDNIPSQYHEKTILVPNAVSNAFLNKIQSCHRVEEKLVALKNGNRRIVGYYGAVAPWFDFDLINYLAEQNGNHEYVFIGPIFEVGSQVEALEMAHANVHFMPMVGHEELVEYLVGFDVAIIPFLKNKITDAVSPLKLFEYMGAGKPIVTTDLRECHNYSNVYIAKSPEEFASYLDAAEVNWNSSLAEQQRVTARLNSWASRVSSILERLVEQPGKSGCERLRLDKVRGKIANVVR